MARQQREWRSRSRADGSGMHERCYESASLEPRTAGERVLRAVEREAFSIRPEHHDLRIEQGHCQRAEPQQRPSEWGQS